MRLAQINLPSHDNDGNPLAVESDILRNLLLAQFGGFTESSAIGAWRDSSDGAVYREPVNVWSIAMDASEENDSALRTIASRISREARQICVFVVFASGEVEFVAPPCAMAAARG